MSTMQTPPPDQGMQPGPPERRCPRCGSTLSPDQEWCLACGAAAGTEVVEARGWRVPMYLGGGLVALAILGIILLIAALSQREQRAGTGTPTPAPSTVAPAPTPSPLPTGTPLPNVTPSPSPVETPTQDPGAEPTIEPPTGDVTPDPVVPSGTFPGWTGADGDYTVIIESSDTQEEAEKVAQEAQDAGESPGILNSSDFSNLNGGYYVVFIGTYASESEAESALDDIKSSYSDAYVRQIK